MIQNQTGNFSYKWAKSGIEVELKDYHQYVVKIEGSSCLFVQNRKFFTKFNPPGCKSLSSISYLKKVSIPLQKSVSSANEKTDFKENLHSQKVISDKAGDNYGKICNAKPATFL